MAKRRKTLPARRPRVASIEEHSLLLRSAESLGRMIGTLQRQLDHATRRIAAGDSGAKSDGKMAATDRKRPGPAKPRKKKTAKPQSPRKRKRATH